MSRSKTVVRRASGLAAAATLCLAMPGCAVVIGGEDAAGASAADYPDRAIEILAPGDAGGGWDTRARGLANALTKCKVTDQSVTVTNKPGAGGTIGLSAFTQHRGDPYRLMTMDTITMLGGIISTDSPIDLGELTPIAGLTRSPATVVVPKDSPYTTLEQLLDAIAADPTGVSVVGGSLGGPDQLLAARLAATKDVAADDLDYVATAGGGKAMSLLLSGAADAGMSSLVEVRGQIQAGELRALAVTSDERISGIDAPTLVELGLGKEAIDSVGGVMAPPGLSDAQQEAVVELIRKATRTSCWAKTLRESDWQPEFLAGSDFGAKIDSDDRVVTGVLDELGLTS